MVFKSRSLKLIIVAFIITMLEYRKITVNATSVVNVRNTHKMQSRSLLFPPTAPTRVQFIGGIGIPVDDLNFESITSGYVLKAEYFLPEKVNVVHQNIKPQTIHRRRKSVNETYIYKETKKNILEKGTFNSTPSLKNDYLESHLRQQTEQNYAELYRWLVYKAIEMILNKSALNGHACMLRSICEHAAVPLNFEGGLLAEILHIVLTPSTSRDKPLKSAHKDYLQAEILGHSGKDCKQAYGLCTKSPLQLITAVF